MDACGGSGPEGGKEVGDQHARRDDRVRESEEPEGPHDPASILPGEDDRDAPGDGAEERRAREYFRGDGEQPEQGQREQGNERACAERTLDAADHEVDREWYREDQGEVRMVHLAGDVRAEAEEEPTDERWPEGACETHAHEERRPRGEGRREQRQDVQRHERPERPRDRRHNEPRARTDRDPRQIHTLWREHPIAEQQVMPVGRRPRCPPERPPEEARVGPPGSHVMGAEVRDDGPAPDRDRQKGVRQEGAEGADGGPRPERHARLPRRDAGAWIGVFFGDRHLSRRCRHLRPLRRATYLDRHASRVPKAVSPARYRAAPMEEAGPVPRAFIRRLRATGPVEKAFGAFVVYATI